MHEYCIHLKERRKKKRVKICSNIFKWKKKNNKTQHKQINKNKQHERQRYTMGKQKRSRLMICHQFLAWMCKSDWLAIRNVKEKISKSVWSASRIVWVIKIAQNETKWNETPSSDSAKCGKPKQVYGCSRFYFCVST